MSLFISYYRQIFGLGKYCWNLKMSFPIWEIPLSEKVSRFFFFFLSTNDLIKNSQHQRQFFVTSKGALTRSDHVVDVNIISLPHFGGKQLVQSNYAHSSKIASKLTAHVMSYPLRSNHMTSLPSLTISTSLNKEIPSCVGGCSRALMRSSLFPGIPQYCMYVITRFIACVGTRERAGERKNTLL